ncbi:MAG: hypothetical protein WC269_04230 [Candidatus Gracilibacteria bacterium]
MVTRITDSVGSLVICQRIIATKAATSDIQSKRTNLRSPLINAKRKITKHIKTVKPAAHVPAPPCFTTGAAKIMPTRKDHTSQEKAWGFVLLANIPRK